MKMIILGEASILLADSEKQTRMEPLAVTDNGAPTAVILPLANADLETVSLSTNPEFIALIEQSRARARVEGSVSAEEMRRRVLPAP
ncbi:MAG: hypothetical protein WKF75_18665 [Singulisphaera sp.]